MEAETVAVVLVALTLGAAAGALAGARRRRGLPPGGARAPADRDGGGGDDGGDEPAGPDTRLLDQRLAAMQTELGRMTVLVRSLEHDRAEQLGLLSGQLRAAGEQTRHLAETTSQLREALVSPKARGQWGERMAEDVLRLAGFLEDVNYRRQTAIPGRGTVPDFTFLLPRDRVVHMDVKFPLDNYVRYVNASRPDDAERHRRAFLRDVRDRIREIGDRGYVDADTTVDCVLLFIPNEQVSAFVQEHDPALLDEALRAKVVCCSPLTLFAVLAVIRQAVDAFALERRSAGILEQLGAFTREWDRFVEQMDRVETHLERARRAYDDLVGVRRRTLERPLDRLDALRRAPSASVDEVTASRGAHAEDGPGHDDPSDAEGPLPDARPLRSAR